MKTPLPLNEYARLEAISESRPELLRDNPALNAMMDEMREEFGVPISALTLVLHDEQRFIAARGLDQDLSIDRSATFCAHTICQDDTLLVEDAREDLRFSALSTVTGDPGVRFYAGAPLRVAEHLPIGALCLIDTRPRRLDAREHLRLLVYASAAQELIQQQALTQQMLRMISPEAARGRRIPGLAAAS